MSNGDRTIWITYNGEIYNYKEIRNLLENNGYSFKTYTDTEVLLAGWVHWGFDVLSRLRGMFAFAIWDNEERRLALCRDRIGIKPLLFAETSSGLIFASTVNALMASGFVAPMLEPQGVFDILATGAVCQPRTIIRGVQCLKPGTCLLCGPGLSRKTITYWDLPDEVERLQPEVINLSYNDAVHRVRDLLEESCRYHLVADVPVGSFLSGGIDSTAITAIMSRQTNSVVKSFSIGFEQKGNFKHELDDARLMASHIGTNHTEAVIKGQDAEESFNELIRVVDQPSYDGANTFFVSRLATSKVKVALSGLGGDELFAGYEFFKDLQDAAISPRRRIDYIFYFIHNIRPNRFTLNAAWRCMTILQRYAQIRRGLSDRHIAKSLSDSMLKYFTPGFVESYVEQLLIDSQNPVTMTSIIECRHYLLNTLLRDADAMSMGHGLEVRPVMLDHRLVEYALSLPSHFKLEEKRLKAILKDAVANMLPAQLLERPKTGFSLPMGLWLRNEMRARLLTVLHGNTARVLFKPTFLKACRENIDSRGLERTLWTLLVLLSWIDEFNIVLPL